MRISRSPLCIWSGLRFCELSQMAYSDLEIPLLKHFDGVPNPRYGRPPTARAFAGSALWHLRWPRGFCRLAGWAIII